MSKATPRNKREFYRRYDRGEFGNRPRTWSDANALACSSYRGNVTARKRESAGACLYGVPATKAMAMGDEYRFNESMPDGQLLIQGELYRNERGLQLSYSEERGKTMREAMRAPRIASGIVATMLLRRHLWPSSYADVMQLLDDYDDAVVEFGAYDSTVGDCPHRNTVIWEVRNY